jgi:hypothetical protein
MANLIFKAIARKVRDEYTRRRVLYSIISPISCQDETNITTLGGLRALKNCAYCI